MKTKGVADLAAGIVVITGGTSGIGLELARIYDARDLPTVVVGRRDPSELDDPLFNRVEYLQSDLADPSAVRRLGVTLGDPIRLLVHNAAIGAMGHPESDGCEQISQLLQVNLRTPIALTHRLLPQLERYDGTATVAFVSSVASALPCPDYALYGASKAALDGLARSLAAELGDRVRVQCVHPGATRTGMHEKIGMDRRVWEKFPPATKTATGIARAIDRGADGGIGLGSRLVRGLGRHFERPLDAYLRWSRR